MILILGWHLLHNLSWFTVASLFLLTALEANTRPSYQNELCSMGDWLDIKRSTSGSLCCTGRWFDINCSTSYSSPKWLSAKINRKDQVVQLSSTQVRANNSVAFSCYTNAHAAMNLTGTQQTISDAANNLTVIGTLVAMALSRNSLTDHKSCSGMGYLKFSFTNKVSIQNCDEREEDRSKRIFHTSRRKLKQDMKNGRGYIPHIKDFPVKFTLGLGFCFSFLVFGISGVYLSVKKYKFLNHKSNFFQKNGGLFLELHIASHGNGTTQIFTAKELERAIDCYKESHIFGPRDTKEAEQDQMERFINKIVTLTQLNHQNVVKFLGCCLETEAPILVYELASKGTLFNYIHHTNGKGSLPWDTLLRIASESAAALAFLHFSAADSSKPLIIHGNVNSSNILLSDCLEAKVSGCGPSWLAPVNESQISTLVERTLGYLDPEYFCTGQLTDKSDVYSFGVVLLEILTGEKPISFDRPEGQRIITSHFVMFMEQNRLFQIVTPQLVDEGNREQVRAVAEVAKRCLKLSGPERPTMEQVAGELKGLSDTYKITGS